MRNRIEKLMLRLVNVPSETATVEEKTMAEEFIAVLREMEYFQNHPQNCGLYKIENDLLERSVAWGLVRGTGDQTVVLINHLDTVDTHDYSDLRPLAGNPQELARQITRFKLNDEVKQDLVSGEWYFGRGVADMKGGAAIQLALLEQYGLEADFAGNVLYLSVPDEETLSAGMRAAVKLLSKLKQEMNLNYVLLIDVETHVRIDADKPVLYGGSIGKLMPSFFVRGVRAHIGNVFQGFSPVALLAGIATRMELNKEFSDEFHGEKAPPPTWMYLRDGKKGYDVSMPETAFGYVSVLTFTSSPEQVLQRMKDIALAAFTERITRYNEAYLRYYQRAAEHDWVPEVYTFEEIYHQVVEHGGEQFKKEWQQELEVVHNGIYNNEYDMPQATSLLIEFIVDKLPHKRPVVVIAFAPPYYPHVVNAKMPAVSASVAGIEPKLAEIYLKKYQQELVLQHFYTAISDMSYASLQDAGQVIPYLIPNMPLWGEVYNIPLSKIAELQIPSINLGPWGKDLHMFTERVYRPDLLERTPWLMDQAIRIALGQIK